MANSYFDIRRDNELITTGTHFWCDGHLSAVPVGDMSADSRYCQSCYNLLIDEASLLPTKSRKPDWIPIRPLKEAQETPQKVAVVPQYGTQIMATIKDGKNKVAIIQPQTRNVTRGKRGPKHKPLPVEIITQWAGEGMGYKGIAAKLKVEHDIDIGFRTIARVVKGERLLI